MGIDNAANPPLPSFVLPRTDLQALLDALVDDGCQVIAPTPEEGAIVYDEVRGVGELPEGWGDAQRPGSYRLRRLEGGDLFSFATGVTGWKRFVHHPVQTTWRAEKLGSRLSLVPDQPEPPKLALVGVRPCEVRAIQLLDQVLTQAPTVDAAYIRQRSRLLIVAVNCAQPADTCFCDSMDSGPRATSGFDLCITELPGPNHRFVIDVGSPIGAEIAAMLPATPATERDLQEARAQGERARERIGRKLDRTGLRDRLYGSPDDRRWEEVAKRCLSCGNCTQVCPTCFCTTMVDTTNLAGDEAARTKLWDSCFSLDFSYIHGGSIRHSPSARYRQWLTHKLASWEEQFGTSGCVGCGRCITWCPVGIDITEEAKAVGTSPTAAQGGLG